MYIFLFLEDNFKDLIQAWCYVRTLVCTKNNLLKQSWQQEIKKSEITQNFRDQHFHWKDNEHISFREINVAKKDWKTNIRDYNINDLASYYLLYLQNGEWPKSPAGSIITAEHVDYILKIRFRNIPPEEVNYLFNDLWNIKKFGPTVLTPRKETYYFFHFIEHIIDWFIYREWKEFNKDVLLVFPPLPLLTTSEWLDFLTGSVKTAAIAADEWVYIKKQTETVFLHYVGYSFTTIVDNFIEFASEMVLIAEKGFLLQHHTYTKIHNFAKSLKKSLQYTKKHPLESGDDSATSKFRKISS